MTFIQEFHRVREELLGEETFGLLALILYGARYSFRDLKGTSPAHYTRKFLVTKNWSES